MNTVIKRPDNAQRVDCKHIPRGTGAVLEYTGPTKESVDRAARLAVATIDFMRSPSISCRPREIKKADGTSEWFASVTYYGLD